MQDRRALDADVFLTNWAYVDHLLIPPGAPKGSITTKAWNRFITCSTAMARCR